MPRRTLMLCCLLPALALPSLAQASDSSLVAALSPYKSTLTVDLILLAEVRTVPAKASIPAEAARLRKVQADMTTVERAARGQTPSTTTGRTAQSQALTALGYAYTSAGDGLAAMAAALAGKAAAAKTDLANEQAVFAKSIPPFELSGKALGLF